VAGRELAFFRGLVRACEIISYLSAVLYVVVGYEFFGSPNSLGAVMGVVVIPVLLWGVLIAQDRYRRHRRFLALCLGAYLLYESISRASILACLVAAIAICVTLRRGKLLLQGGFILIMFTASLAVVQPEQFGSLVSAFTEDVVYKGKPESGILGSRTGPWQETVDVIKQSPWFGSGFGTDLTPARPGAPESILRSGANQEHGNGYLALLQYVGILGVVPFATLLFLVLRLVYRTFCWMRRSQTPLHYSVPLALISLAGWVHAFFEDWLFAVGYYLTVFFWSSVFILADLQPLPVSAKQGERKRPGWHGMNWRPSEAGDL
jgi:O-antigen ligase